MTSTLPTNLNQAVATGLGLLNDESKRELATIGYVDPHTQYQTKFIAFVGEELGIFDRSNQALLEDVAENYVDRLHFLELADPETLGQATVRIVLAAMAKQLRLTKPA
jgi:hypothetical protein